MVEHTLESLHTMGSRFVVGTEPRRWKACFGFRLQTVLVLSRYFVFQKAIQLLVFCHYIKVYPSWDELSNWAHHDVNTVKQYVEFVHNVLVQKLPPVSSISLFLFLNININFLVELARKAEWLGVSETFLHC